MNFFFQIKRGGIHPFNFLRYMDLVKKNRELFYIKEEFPVVPKVGIEPTHLAIHDFESCASTNSATSAFLNWERKSKSKLIFSKLFCK